MIPKPYFLGLSHGVPLLPTLNHLIILQQPILEERGEGSIGERVVGQSMLAV